MISSVCRRTVGSLKNLPIKRAYINEIQHGLYTFQSYTGLPWWISIATSTLIVKTSILPLVRLQILAANKVGKIAPEMAQLIYLLRENILKNPNTTTREKIQGIRLVYKGFRSLCVIHDTPIFPIFLYPMINIVMFISFVYSVRGIVEDDLMGALGMGGDFWFRDLVYRDETLILPSVAIMLTYLGIELGFRNSVGKYATTFKDIAQCFVLLVAPVTTSLPAGIFCYWIPSSLFNIAQSLLLKQPAVMRALRIPTPINRDFKLPKD